MTSYKGIARFLGKPSTEKLPEIVTVKNLLQLFENKGLILTPTSDKIVIYADENKKDTHIKVPVPLPLPDHVPTIEINPKIRNAVDSGQALIVGVVNDFHSLCLVIIYDIETNAYMCYSFGVGGQENDKHFSIYQPDFTLVGLDSFSNGSDGSNQMAKNIRESRIVDIQPFTNIHLNKYYELFYKESNFFRFFTLNFVNLLPTGLNDNTRQAINCAFALSYILNIKTSAVGITGIFDQGRASVGETPMNTGRLYSLVNEFIHKRKAQSTAASAANNTATATAAAAAAADDNINHRSKNTKLGGTRQRKTTKRKGRKTNKRTTRRSK